MTETDIVTLLRDTIWTVLLVGGPMMLAALVVGTIISLLQALTQVNEQALLFVPKVVAVAATGILMAPFIGHTLGSFSRELYDRIIAIGGAG